MDGSRRSLFQGVASQQSAQTTAADRMKCWIMKAGRQVRDSNVRHRSQEMGLVATRGKGTSCSTTPVDISSARQTQTRNVKTVRHDQRLHGPHTHTHTHTHTTFYHLPCSLLAIPRLTRSHAGIIQRKTPFDPRPVHMG